MNYRHAFHAGNHIDVFKHAALVFVLEWLAQKPTPDILAEVGRIVRGVDSEGAATRAPLVPRPVLVGFAAETGSLARAGAKMRAKGVDISTIKTPLQRIEEEEARKQEVIETELAALAAVMGQRPR